MIGSNRVLAVIPARGGSKGIRLKNIRPFLGRPLISWVTQVVADVAEIDRTVVSTDNVQVAQVASEAGLDVPFTRPADLSGDRVADQPVLEHALLEVEKSEGARYDIIVMLQPTSPLRTPGTVSAAITTLARDHWDSVWTVSLTDSKNHPLKQLRVREGAIEYYDPRAASIVARQQLEHLYHKDGAAYVMTRHCLLDQKSIKGRRCGALISEAPMLSIDTQEDLRLAESYMRDRYEVDSDGVCPSPRHERPRE